MSKVTKKEMQLMGLTAGARLKIARELMAQNRSEFCDTLNFNYIRLVTIEGNKGRMSVDDLAQIVRPYPELMGWIVLGTPLDIAACAKSTNEHMRMLADNLETHGYPEEV